MHMLLTVGLSIWSIVSVLLILLLALGKEDQMQRGKVAYTRKQAIFFSLTWPVFIPGAFVYVWLEPYYDKLRWLLSNHRQINTLISTIENCGEKCPDATASFDNGGGIYCTNLKHGVFDIGLYPTRGNQHYSGSFTQAHLLDFLNEAKVYLILGKFKTVERIFVKYADQNI